MHGKANLEIELILKSSEYAIAVWSLSNLETLYLDDWKKFKLTVSL